MRSAVVGQRWCEGTEMHARLGLGGFRFSEDRRRAALILGGVMAANQLKASPFGGPIHTREHKLDTPKEAAQQR